MSYPVSPLKWLYVDFNSYFASVEQQDKPHLRNRPVAVVPVETDATCAIAASYEAKAFGVRTGTPIHEARKLCPDLICVLARHDIYVDYHHRAIAEIERHLPVEKTCSIDEMACRLLLNEAAPDTARAIALRIKAGLAGALGQHVRCSIGIASNMYLAKVATDLRKPDGLTIVMPDDLPHCLLPLALRDLPGIGRNMEMRLHDAGIQDMRQLLALDRKRMKAIWGSSVGEKLWYELRGIHVPDAPPRRGSVGHSHVLAPQDRPIDSALEIARRLLLKACSRLRRMGYHAGLLHFSARIEDGRRISLERVTVPTQDSVTFLALLNDMWRAMLHVLTPGRDRIKKLGVTLLHLKNDVHLQGDLFLNPMHSDGVEAGQFRHRERSLRLSCAMDDINSRFGRDSVLIGVLPTRGRRFSGTKIAFNRIPDREEFSE